jgi:hypothetical protein
MRSFGFLGDKQDVKSLNLFFVSYFQRNCLEFALKAKPMPHYIPQNRWQYRIWSVVTSQAFEYLNFSLIMLNTISLGMKFYRQPDWYTELLDVGNIFFTAVFTIELFLKLAAFGIKVLQNKA